ncbi:MAG: hypothetical protein CME70_05675 [Halobacteriovorax sp.]|nr:hypothetical protein [Halobacteriovorax sp.]|tara:strand:+ start:348 stop:581 length:234 start_codon:yes stop_codon:yes gene_type:complete
MRTTDRQLRTDSPTIDEMRHDLAEQEAMNMNTSDIINILIDGFEGLDNMPDIEIRDEWNALFGEKGSYGEEKSVRTN